jgi:hypothetical protein
MKAFDVQKVCMGNALPGYVINANCSIAQKPQEQHWREGHAQLGRPKTLN